MNKFDALKTFQAWPPEWQRLCAEYWIETGEVEPTKVSTFGERLSVSPIPLDQPKSAAKVAAVTTKKTHIVNSRESTGFTLDELHRLSQLVLGHRGKLRKLETQLEDISFVQQLMALRLAVILCHARRDPDLSGLRLECDTERRTTQLHMASAWAELWPQSAHLLREEKNAWQKTDWSLTVHMD